MSKILANQIANYGDNSPVEVKEGVNIPADKPLQADGDSGTAGQVLASTGTSIEWVDSFDGDYNSLTNLPTIPAAQVRADWNAVGSIAEILNKPVVPAQPSVSVVTPSANGNLAYNQANGLFTFTPPDLSGYALVSSVANAANWDTAYSWGDHAVAGYATTTQLNTAVANSSNWNTAYGWGDHATVGYLTTGLQDLVDDTTPQLGGTLDLNGNGITGIGTISCTGLVTASDSILLGNASSEFIIQFSQSTGTSPQIRNSIGTTGIGIYGAYDFGGTHAQDVHLGTSGQPSWFKNVEPYTDSSYDLGTSSKKWNNFYVNNLYVSGTTDIALENLGDVDVTAGLSDQQVLKWDAASSSWKPANDLVGGQSAIELADLSVSTNPAGSPSLSYNNTNGVFTYTPPDLSPYLTSFTETDPVFTSSPAFNILNQNITNWNLAYGWGDHSTAGYLTSIASLNTITDVNLVSLQDGQILRFNLSSGKWENWTSNYLTSYTESDPVFLASPASGIASMDITNWNTAYNWGDHATQGYLTSLGDAAGVTAAKISNWDTAYSWGDHSTQGYLTSVSISLGGVSDVTINSPSNGQVLTYNGTAWVNSALPAAAANVTISDTAPGSPDPGDLWWESDKGRLKVYYNDTDSSQWVDASPPLYNPLTPVAVGCITLNGTSPTWTGTAGYTVSGAQPGGAGTDYEITLTFPTAYSARTDYIVQATYDGTNYVSGNGASIGVDRGTASVVFTPRRWDENPLSLGEIMVTITNL